jgi:hypothetical protein
VRVRAAPRRLPTAAGATGDESGRAALAEHGYDEPTLSALLGRPASDINERALSFARRIACLNGVRRIRFAAGDGMTAAGDGDYDVILANLPYVSRPLSPPHRRPDDALRSRTRR